MTWAFKCEILAFVIYFLYASFFEWMFHKYLFHSPRLIKATYKAHQIIHHQKYKYEPHSYEHRDVEEKGHISMDWFALPLFIGFHLPFQILIQYVTGIPSLWGGVAAIVTYYTVYEYFHYCMHVPSGRWFEKVRPFTFAKEHHRIHHKYMQRNLNVFFPLADLCLGTYVSVGEAARRAAQKAAPVATSTGTPRPMTVQPLRVSKDSETVPQK